MLTPELEKRMMLGLAAQPFVAAALAFALFPLIDYTGRPLYGSGSSNLETAFQFSVLMGVVASFVTGFMAYPGLGWLLKRGPIAWPQALTGGVVLGNVPAALIMLAMAARQVSRGGTPTLENMTYGPAGALRILMLGSALGLAGAAVFWWLAGRYLSGDPRKSG